MKKMIFLMMITCSVNAQWVEVTTGYSHFLLAVNFRDTLNGFTCGGGGMILRTTNGGINWESCNNSGINSNLNDIKFMSDQTLIATGDFQTILRSTDGGNNWTTVSGPISANYRIRHLTVLSSTEAVAISSDWISPYYYSFVYKTTNAGETWIISQIYVGTSHVRFLNLNTGWSNSLSSLPPPYNQYFIRVRKTTNGGLNFTTLYESNGNNVNPGIIYFYNESFGFRVLDILTVYLLRSMSGGTSWTGVLTLPLNSKINNFYFINTSTGWFVGNNSAIYKTTNTGLNWNQQSSPVTAIFYYVSFVDENRGWVAGGNILLKTTNGGTHIGIVKINTEIPSQFSLSQNYPNPFNPISKIKFQIAKLSFVKLVVYGILGREAATLVNEQLQPGTYEAEFDGKNFPSGVYFYRLVTYKFSETRKMVLIK